MSEKRNIGIEMLRILSMFWVVTMHICTQGGVLNAVKPFTGNYTVAWVIMCLTYCAVNCYALISGYVGVEAKFSYHRIVALWFRVIFYTMIITITFDLLKPESVSFMDYVKALTPATSRQYWYFSAYFALFMMMPFLNFLLHELSTKQLDMLIITLVMVFSVLPTLRHTDPFALGDGYSALWLMILYLIGGYLRKRKLLTRYNKKVWIGIYISMITIAITSKFLLEYICWKVLGTMAGGGYLISYVSPVVLLMAIGLLGVFAQLNINCHKVINFVAGATFSVFIIHEHPLMKHQFISDNFSKYAQYSPVGLLFSILGTALIIFIVCTLIDFIRQSIFKILKVNMICKSIVDKTYRVLSRIQNQKENERDEEF